MLDFYDVCIPENSHKVYKCKMIDGTDKLLQVYYDSETGDTSMFDFNNVYNNIEYGCSDIDKIVSLEVVGSPEYIEDDYENQSEVGWINFEYYNLDGAYLIERFDAIEESLIRAWEASWYK